MKSETPLLRVHELVVEIPTRHALLTPVNGVSLDIHAGEILGLVGESGAGKSMMGSAVIGLLDRPARITAGEVLLQEERVDNLSAAAMRKVRGRRIGMIFQDPSSSLNPLLTVGEQLVETAERHLDVSRREARERAVELLVEVGIPAAKERLDAYPHEFSGGMRQRVVIALALIAEPSLVIADEPTTALDVSVQSQILMLLRRLCTERGMGVLLITHDMGVIAETCDRVAVLYAGRLAETGPTRSVVADAKHPYTRGLMAATPTPETDAHSKLAQIPGAMPDLSTVPSGCPFHPRCEQALSRCSEQVPPVFKLHETRVACFLHEPDRRPDVNRAVSA